MTSSARAAASSLYGRLRRVALWVSLVLLRAAPALAHAPPEATGIWWTTSGGHDRVVVRTNRGLIVTDDGGVTFRLQCNDAFGASLTEVAPFVSTSSGRFLIATYAAGLYAVSDDLCEFTAVPGPLAKGTNVVGLNTVPGAPASLLAILSSQTNSDHFLASNDDGQTWRAPSHVEDFLFTLQVAPSDGARLYASALHPTDGGTSVYRLLVSRDGGLSFETHALALTDSEVGVSVLAVDPALADRAFIRTAAYDPTILERLIRTDDAGKTFVDVMTLRGPSNVAASPDGSTIWLGAQDGMFRSTDHGKTFVPLAAAGVTQVSCLQFHDGKLFACGLSSNVFGVLASFDQGDTFSFYLRFPDVTAPLACPATSFAEQACAPRFDDWRLEQGLPLPSATGGEGGATGASSGATGASSGALGGESGVPGGSASASGAPSGGTSMAGTPNGTVPAKGCSCRFTPREEPTGPESLEVTALLVFTVTRRKRRT